jgi:hypothetical protein
VTAPNQQTPENAANFDSLAAFAAKTQEDWEAEYKAETEAPWQYMLDGFFQELAQGQAHAVAIMGGIAEGLGLGAVWSSTTEVIDALSNWVVNIVTDALALAEEIYTNIIGAITGNQTPDLGVLEDWADDVWALGEDALELGQDVVDSLIQGFHGWWDSVGFAPLDVRTLSTTIATAVAELNAAIIALQSTTAGTAFSGTAVYENFTAGAPAYPSGPSLGAKWDQWYEGTGDALLGIANNYAVMQGSSLGRYAITRYKGDGGKAITATTRQRIGLVASVPANWGLRSYNYILGRMGADAATKKYVFAKLSNNTAEIGYRNGGGEVMLGSVPNFRYKNGAIYWLECGFGDSDRTFRLFENSTLLLTVTDAGNGSLLGTEYRGGGFATYSPNSLTRPGVVAALAFYDNAPRQVLGSGMRRCRTIGNTAKLSKGTQPFPKGWFTTSEYMTADLAYNSDTNTVTVGASGWYAVDVVQYADGQIGLLTGGLIRAAVYRNGMLEVSGAPVNANVNTDMLGFSAHLIIYANKGDTLTPYYISEWECADYLRADSTGKGTWFAVTFLGNTRPIEN